MIRLILNSTPETPKTSRIFDFKWEIVGSALALLTAGAGVIYSIVDLSHRTTSLDTSNKDLKDNSNKESKQTSTILCYSLPKRLF